MPPRSANRRSLMLFSALQPERWDDGLAAGPDILAFDLEDGTAPDRRAEARTGIGPVFTRDPKRPMLKYLRINNPRTPDGLRDLLALLDWATPPDGLLLPKVESPEEVRWVTGIACAAHPDIELILIIESPRGLEIAAAIAGAAPQVAGLLLGADDLSGDLGSDRGWDALAYARGRVVAAAADAGVEAMDGAFYDPEDETGLIAEVERVAAMGFTGKASYHADQIPHIHAGFTPGAAAIAQAQRVLDAAAADTVGNTRLDGKLVNAAVVKAARRLLTIAERRGAA
ncbi:MAG: CoA ester lyase [Alphaproteobacteria bacterium]